MSTPAQIKAIHTLRRQVPMLGEDDVYRDLLKNTTGKCSSKDLNEVEARRVLAELESLITGRPNARAHVVDPKSPLVSRLLREAYSAGWDQPEAPGLFDDDDAAKRSRVRARVQAWLQDGYPHIHGTPKRLEAWPLEALQACLEHLKGKVGAGKRWGKRYN